MDESVAAARVKAILMLVGCVGAAQVDVEAWYDGRLAKGERAWHFCIGCDELVGPLGVESLLGKCCFVVSATHEEVHLCRGNIC